MGTVMAIMLISNLTQLMNKARNLCFTFKFKLNENVKKPSNKTEEKIWVSNLEKFRKFERCK